ncbi:MAG: helix-turn-helix transcriptional regulator [bacterium]|nr:helix-turn-helix transcriptional regulator [bacterium]
MDIEKLPRALKALRECRGLHQTELAARIRERTDRKVTASRLSQWEKGKALLTLESLAAILTGLDADFHDLQDTMDAEASLVAADREREPLLDGFLSAHQRHLDLDRNARERLRRLLKVVGEVPEIVQRLERLEKLADEATDPED